ncbi:MAG: cyclic nucleotide-binding domain-containing protein [Sandaracinaceae bacterium]
MASALSAPDRMWEDRITGDLASATWRALRVLDADPGQLEAVLLLLELLGESLPPAPPSRGKRQRKAPPRRPGDPTLRRAAQRLVEAHVARGDLAGAVAAVRVGDRVGLEPGAALRRVAERFGRGGAPEGRAGLAPPPLPVRLPDEDPPSGLDREALDAEARAALEAWSRAEPEPSRRAPRVALFGRLEPAALAELLGTFTLQRVAGGERVITEGEEGKAAYVVVRGRLAVERGDALLGELGPGSLFGEMALVTEAPREASVRAEEATLLLHAGRDDLEEAAHGSPVIGTELTAFCRQRMLANLVTLSPILAAVDPLQRGALVERFRTRTFAPGELLVEQGQEAAGLFLIGGGRVAVRSHDADGEQLELAALGAGDVVGEISVVLRRPATADVVATHATVALELTRDAFRDAIRAHPQLLNELYEVAAKREEETRSVVAQRALDVEEVVLL